MEKFQRDIENMIDSIPVSDKLDETVQIALEKAKKHKRRSIISNQNVLAGLASILVLGIGMVLFSTTDEDQAASQPTEPVKQTEPVPYTESIIYATGDEGLKRMAKEGSVQKLSLASEDQGVKFYLEEAYLDGNQLAVGYRVEFDEMKTGTMDDDSLIYLEWNIDGKNKEPYSHGGLSTRQMIDSGYVFQFETPKNFSDEPKIDIHIERINDIEGDWSFTFDLKKEQEYQSYSKLASTEDPYGNKLEITDAHLSPSTLEFKISTRISQKELWRHHKNSNRELMILAIDNDGFSHYQDSSYRDSNPFNTTYKVSRGIDAHSYKVIPFTSTDNGKKTPDGELEELYKLSAPFKKGASIGHNKDFTIESITENGQHTVIQYSTNRDPFIPRLPILVGNREQYDWHGAVSFKKEGNMVEVKYPKVDLNTIKEFLIYDETFTTLEDLETEFHLK